MSRRVHLEIESTETIGVPGEEMSVRMPACAFDSAIFEDWTDEPDEVWCKHCRRWMKENLVTETTAEGTHEET